jgi:hypothetical protein
MSRLRVLDPGSLVAGVVLIVVGVILLLDRVDAIDLRFDYLWPLLAGALGAILLACGLAGPRRG